VDETPRILGIDPGERRVGFAVSDPLGLTAQGLETFDRKRGDLIAHVSELVEDYGVTGFVVGHPLSMSGRPNQSSQRAEELARSLEKRFAMPVVLWDERLSSAEARRYTSRRYTSRRVTAGARGRDKGAVDRVAAVLILQSYLDSKR
jgi:putative Holliday junction resolvase